MPWLEGNLRELAVDVDGVEARDEVDENIVDALGNLGEKGRGNGLVGGVLGKVDGDEELLSLLINVTNIDTTLVCEENPVALFWEGVSGNGIDQGGSDRRLKQRPKHRRRW